MAGKRSPFVWVCSGGLYVMHIKFNPPMLSGRKLKFVVGGLEGGRYLIYRATNWQIIKEWWLSLILVCFSFCPLFKKIDTIMIGLKKWKICRLNCLRWKICNIRYKEQICSQWEHINLQFISLLFIFLCAWWTRMG